jgi:hypothetical protein
MVVFLFVCLIVWFSVGTACVGLGLFAGLFIYPKTRCVA